MAKLSDPVPSVVADDPFARLSGMPAAYFEAQRELYPAGDHGALRLFLALRSAARRIDNVVGGWLDRNDLTSTKLDVLHLLAANGIAGMTTSALRNSLMMTQPNVTYVVHSLERAKLVRRKAGKGDRRTSIISITRLGSELIARETPRHLDAIAAALAGVDDADRERAIATLATIAEGFERRARLD